MLFSYLLQSLGLPRLARVNSIPAHGIFFVCFLVLLQHCICSYKSRKQVYRYVFANLRVIPPTTRFNKIKGGKSGLTIDAQCQNNGFEPAPLCGDFKETCSDWSFCCHGYWTKKLVSPAKDAVTSPSPASPFKTDCLQHLFCLYDRNRTCRRLLSYFFTKHRFSFDRKYPSTIAVLRRRHPRSNWQRSLLVLQLN